MEGEHEELEIGEPGEEKAGDAGEMDGLEIERKNEEEADYREKGGESGGGSG